MAAAALAVATLALVFAVVEPDSPDRDGPVADARSAGGQSALPGPPGLAGRTRPPVSPTIVLPNVPDNEARPLQLTRAMLQQARLHGTLDVRLPGGERYPVALEADRLEPGDQWTLVGRVQTRLGPQAMVLTSGPDALFGVLPLPDGSMMRITTTRGRTEIAVDGGLLPPELRNV